MVCRETRGGSASTSFAMQVSGMEEREVLSLFHQLRNEYSGPDRPPTREEVNAWADEQIRRVQTQEGLTQARRASLIRRYEEAREETPSAADFAAWTWISHRSQAARADLDQRLSRIAARSGSSVDEVRDAFRRHYAEGTDRSLGNQAPQSWVEQFRGTATNGVIPRDRGTMYALWRMEQDSLPAGRPDDLHPARQPVAASWWIDSAGYDRATGRMDVEISGTVYTYEGVAPEVADGILNGRNPGTVFNASLRRRPVARRCLAGSRQDVQHCPDCGQFVGSGDHVCPSPGVVSDGHGVTPVALPVDAPEGLPVFTDTGERAIPAVDFTVRAPSRRGMQAFASEHPTFEMGTRVTAADGAEVDGNALVRQMPDGQFRVDSHRLRCSCGRFTADGTCNHVETTRDALEAIANGRRGTGGVRAMSMGIASGDEQLAADHAVMVAAQGVPRREDGSVSYSESMEHFQAVYDAARLRAANGEAAVPFLTENALGGTDRAFGVEIEFDVSDEDSLQRIADDLHAAGLIRAPQQGYYHSTASAARSGEWNRWGFEDDFSVMGEIVSPVMTDNPRDWQELALVCEIVKRHGGMATDRTGGHVHVGLHDYDHTIENHNRLVGESYASEDILYRLGQNPARSTHRLNWYSHARRSAPRAYKSVDDVWEAESGAGVVNFRAVEGDERDHVEVRVFDSSLDPGVIQAQIKTSVGMVEAALRGEARPNSAEPLGTHRRARGSKRRLTGADWAKDTRSFRNFVDRIFHRDIDKEQVTSLFAVTGWQQRPSSW